MCTLRLTPHHGVALRTHAACVSKVQMATTDLQLGSALHSLHMNYGLKFGTFQKNDHLLVSPHNDDYTILAYVGPL